jgi:hypothetical protein
MTQMIFTLQFTKYIIKYQNSLQYNLMKYRIKFLLRSFYEIVKA